MAARDFIHHRTFPGTTGNIFDVVLHIADFVESLPAFVFAAVLLGIACLPLLAVSFSPPLILLYLFFLAACRRDPAMLRKAPLGPILVAKTQGSAPLMGERQLGIGAVLFTPTGC